MWIEKIKFFWKGVDIEYMKKLALIMIFSVSSVVLSAEEYTIQTISTLKEKSITPAFEKKVEKSTLQSVKKKEGECNIVTVGHYKSVKEAHVDLKKAKAIAKDAFIRPLNRATPKVCETHTATAKGSVVEHKEENAVAAVHNVTVKKEEPAAAVHETVVSPVVSTVAENHTAVIPQESKAEPCKVQPCENSVSPVYVYDRNLARKSDIQEAIEYYKRSPYHTFKPVLSQR